MSPAAAPRPVKARTRRAWSALAVAGTVVLITGVLTAAAGEALAPGAERGTPPATVAGLLLAACGLACGAALLAAAAAPAAQRRRGGPGASRAFRRRGAARRPAVPRESGALGPLSSDGRLSSDGPLWAPATAGRPVPEGRGTAHPGSAAGDGSSGEGSGSGPLRPAGQPEAAPRGPFEPATPRGELAAPSAGLPGPGDNGPGETSEEWLRSLRPGGPPR